MKTDDAFGELIRGIYWAAENIPKLFEICLDKLVEIGHTKARKDEGNEL